MVETWFQKLLRTVILLEYHSCVHKTVILALVKMVRKTLFKITAIGLLHYRREMGLNLEYSKDSWRL